MRKLTLPAAFAASLLRDLFLACAWTVSRPFICIARGFDALARRVPEVSTGAACDAPPAAGEDVGAYYIDTRSL